MSLPFAPSQVIFEIPRRPKTFHGDLYEDAEDWVDYFDRVAALNGWDDLLKVRNVYFSIEDAARVWFKNREASYIVGRIQIPPDADLRKRSVQG